QDVAVLAGAGLGLVGVDDEIGRPAVALLGHEGPFQPGREAGAAAAAQAGRLHLVDDPVPPPAEDVLGAVPLAARHRALQGAVEPAVDVGEDAVLILQQRDRTSYRLLAEDADIFLDAAPGQRVCLSHPVVALDAAPEVQVAVDPGALLVLP